MTLPFAPSCNPQIVNFNEDTIFQSVIITISNAGMVELHLIFCGQYFLDGQDPPSYTSTVKKKLFVTDKAKIGRLIAWGGEHFVYEYDTDRVIKFSALYFCLGSKAIEKATQDYDTCKNYFGKYLLETEIAISPNNKHIVRIQPKIVGHFLTKKDLEHGYIQKQFKEIVNAYHSMIKAKNTEIDLIGRGGVFRRCLSNILVTTNNELLIFDATLMEVTGFLKPIVFLLRKFITRRQSSTIKFFLS
jgi:hypothetical protein